jgi:hypothetical protein
MVNPFESRFRQLLGVSGQDVLVIRNGNNMLYGNSIFNITQPRLKHWYSKLQWTD